MTNEMFKKEAFKKSVKDNVKFLYRKTIEEATQEQIFQAVSYSVKDVIIDNWLATQKAYDEQDPKIVYYMSMEFLMGRALGNNLINLCAYGEVKEALEELGFDLNCIEDQEPDPALGNGGLGRLAACFLDSLATLNYAAYGCGIRYHYGMFKQKIQNGYQIEVPDNWLKNGYPFELRRPEYAKEVHFGGYVRVEYDPEKGGNKFIHEGYQAVKAIPYDMPITGYDNDVVNTLRIWDAEPIVDFELDSFDKGDYKKAVEQENLARTIVEVLYPNDNHMAGKELRLKQQYFFVSASLQAAIAKYKKTHDDITKLHEKVVFQMNDTHPTVAVAELMRILIDEEGLGWDQAWDITTKCCAYTNHTIMSEALEKWPIELFSRLLPRVYQIIEEINRRFILEIQQKYPGNFEKIKKMAIIYDGQVKMAHLAIAAGYSVNGVARLHTEILKKQELKDFYEMMPEKFNNKTNGITQRRFLLHGNPLLAKWVTAHVGDEWITDLPKIKELTLYVDDEKAQKEFGLAEWSGDVEDFYAKPYFRNIYREMNVVRFEFPGLNIRLDYCGDPVLHRGEPKKIKFVLSNKSKYVTSDRVNVYLYGREGCEILPQKEQNIFLSMAHMGDGIRELEYEILVEEPLRASYRFVAEFVFEENKNNCPMEVPFVLLSEAGQTVPVVWEKKGPACTPNLPRV